MCHFIVAVFPSWPSPDKIVAGVDHHVRDRLTLAFTEFSNPGLARRLAPGQRYGRITRRFCDCGTALGRGSGPSTRDREHAAKLQKRGWSGAKISRWLRQKTGFEAPEKQEAADWALAIQQISAASKASDWGLILHWWVSTLEDEEVPLHDSRRVAVSQVNEAFVRDLEEDVLYRFHHETKS